MSWLTNLAGRAEALLNQVDQAASDSLRDVGFNTPQKPPDHPLPHTHQQDQLNNSLSYEPIVQSTQPNQGTSVAQVLVGTAPRPSLSKKPPSDVPIHTSTPRKSSSTSTANDDKLFEFLNSPSKPKETVYTQPKTPPLLNTRRQSDTSKPSTIDSSRSSPVVPQDRELVKSTSSKEESGESAKVANIGSSEVVIQSTEPVVEETDDPEQLIDSADPTDNVTSTQAEVANDEQHSDPVEVEQNHEQGNDDLMKSQAKIEGLKQTVSNYELENKLLKREISSLNEELSTLMSKLNTHEESVAHYESEIHALREQASRTDHMIRQLRSHDEDLQASLDARDSQIQVLRTRLTEADKRVEEQDRQLIALSVEKERFLQDANLSSTAHSHALDSMKTQLKQHQSLFEQERETFRSRQQEAAERESRLQAELTQVREEMVGHQRQVAVSQTRCGELQTEVQRSQQEAQAARREHEEYKLRAAGILQAKEKLITSLQSGEGGEVGVVSEAKLEELRLEKEHLQAQLQSALQAVDGLEAELQECMDRHSVEVGRLVEQVRVCEGVLAEERRTHSATRGELTRLSQELEDTRESLLREKSAAADILQRSESELTTLKSQLSSTLSPSRAEQESRLHELTESLIQKQTSLETLSAERNSLNLQLQRVQAQLSEAQKTQSSRSHTAVVMNSQDDSYRESAQVRPMTSVISSLDNAPSDSKLHNVKRAVNTLDKFSIRLGVFLRRYPHARLFALLYMVLLHVWVMVVLLTYTPETHDIGELP